MVEHRVRQAASTEHTDLEAIRSKGRTPLNDPNGHGVALGFDGGGSRNANAFRSCDDRGHQHQAR